jgi:hypothetical protein
VYVYLTVPVALYLNVRLGGLAQLETHNVVGQSNAIREKAADLYGRVGPGAHITQAPVVVPLVAAQPLNFVPSVFRQAVKLLVGNHATHPTNRA